MREEYTDYPCSGKKYNGEKAIISLTSWTARINTVSKTLFSLLKQCPGFHIVLVLSEEEFPKREEELPEDLMMFVDNELIELLWVYKNYKSFKKVLFTMDKYRDVPVISADDDCIYICNYAQELYDKWTADKETIVSYTNAVQYGIKTTFGCATLYPPNYFKGNGISLLNDKITNIELDDNYYVILRKRLNLTKTNYIAKSIKKILFFQNDFEPLRKMYGHDNLHHRAYEIIDKLVERVDNL